MRPIHKGGSPYKSISKYADAKPFLREVIGEYCCYCEIPIFHVPEVDHVVSKSRDGDITGWDNLLFSCKYCNTRKGDRINQNNVDEYMWPDKYNTALAFSYANAQPMVNIEKLDMLDPTGNTLKKAMNIYNLVKLGETPNINENRNREKDKRFWKREETRKCAKDCLDLLKAAECMDNSISKEVKKVIIDSAISNGFFSIWMTVFQDYSEMLLEFISVFKGTEKRYYKEDGSVSMLLQIENE